MIESLSIGTSERAAIRRKRSDVVADLIRGHIFQAGLKPNDRLPQEHKLIEMFACSRSTVREALKSLEVQGLVQNSTGPTGGARVALVSPGRIVGLLGNYFYSQPINTAQIYQIRRLVEPELAYAVVGHLQPSHLAALERAIAVQEDHSHGPGDWEHHRRAEMDFHDILIEACPNPLLGLVCRFVNEAIRSAIGRMDEQHAVHHEKSAVFTAENIDFHKQLLVAFRSGDATEARRVMLEHVLSAECFVVPPDHAGANLPIFVEPLRLE
jgi:GntR family transcriptional repressor for pyruvate dehydrogenase complex